MKSLIYIFFILSTSLYSQDTLSYSKFTTQQYQDWEVIEKKWRQNEFQNFLKKNNIKMTCAKCTSVYAWLVFKCDSSGTSFQIIKSKKCGEELKGKQGNEFKETFRSIQLPASFLNTHLKVYMGNGLKC